MHATASSVFDMLSDGGSGWAYRTVKAEACYNKIINRIRLNVAKAGTFTIGKTDGMTYTRLQTIHLQHPTTSPKQATLQVYPIHPVTLGANERLVLGQPDDTGRFNHHRNTSHKPEGLFDGGITSSRPSGLSISPNNLSIDIGWYPFPILDIYHHDDAPNAEACTQVDATMLAQPIRYYRKFSPGKWETLCLPFNVERITVYDPDDDAEYNLHAQYLYNGVRQAGDFWLYAFHEDVVGLQEFQPNWHEIEATCPAEALPKKDVPYIMMMPAGDYYQDKYVVFHSKREAIALTPFAPVRPSADNQFTYQGNTTLMPQTITHAYLLNTTTDYFVAQETAVLYPFECAVFATQATTRRLPRLSFTEQDDVTTSIPLPNQADGEAMLFTITGMYMGRYATESELTKRIHALPQGWYIIRRNTAVQKIWRADE